MSAATLTVAPAATITLRCGATICREAEVLIEKAGIRQTFAREVEIGEGFDTLPAGRPAWGYDVDAWEVVLGLDHVRANAIRTEDGLVLWEDPDEGERITWYRVREIRLTRGRWPEFEQDPGSCDACAGWGTGAPGGCGWCGA